MSVQNNYISSSANSLAQIWQDYSNYIAYSLPFIFARVFTPFKTGESMTVRIVEGAIFSAIASGVEYGVTHGKLSDYSFSYLPMLGTFLYHQDPLKSDNTEVKLGIATGSTVLVKYALDTANWQYLIPPVITYTACKLNNVANNPALVLAAISGGLDYYFDTHQDKIHQHNYATWSVIGGAIGHNLASKSVLLKNIETQYQAITAVTAAIVGNLAPFESIVLEQLFAPEHFKKSYNSLAQFANKDKLDLAIERHFVMTSTIQFGLSFYGNFLVVRTQEKNNQLVAIGYIEDSGARTNAYNNFIKIAQNYIIAGALYTCARLVFNSISTYNEINFVNTIQNDLTDKLLTSENFIQSSSANYTVQAYRDDINTIALERDAEGRPVLKWHIFGFPKLTNLGKLDFPSVAALASIAIIDSVFKSLLDHISSQAQYYRKLDRLCDSNFDKHTAHSKEYATVILQRDALNITHEEWNSLQLCKHNSMQAYQILMGIIGSGQYFYQSEMLYTTLHMLVGYLSKNQVITPEQLFLYTKALEIASDILLFNTKNHAAFQNTESAMARLNELHKHLASNTNTIDKIYYHIDHDSNVLIIDSLNFTRGNKEQQVHLSIDKLTLELGKIYAITGANGGGKSSFTILLKYAVDHIADPSFHINSGTFTYPSDSVFMLPQKDYVPYNVSLFEFIFYPTKVTHQDYEDKVIKLIQELQIFGTDQLITYTELHKAKDDWKDLSGGQKKKLFMIKPFIECPKVIIMDETFGPLDPVARVVVMDKINDSCLKESLILVVWHKDKNEDGTSCVKDSFFDYELHLQNNTLVQGQVGVDCLY